MKPLISVIAALCLSGAAQTAPLFTQTPPNLNSYDMVDSRIADVFTISLNSTLSNISFWYQAQYQTDLSNASWAIYRDSGGTLGSLVGTGSATVSSSVDTNAYLATFAVPSLALSIGSYWLELHGGTALNDDNGGLAVYWEAVDDTGAASALANASLGLPNAAINTSGYNQYAFVLDGTSGPAVPEPASWAMALGGAGVLLARRRRSV